MDKVEWFELKLTKKQISFIRLLCRFHLQLSLNSKAREANRKLQWCLDHWTKRVNG